MVYQMVWVTKGKGKGKSEKGQSKGKGKGKGKHDAAQLSPFHNPDTQWVYCPKPNCNGCAWVGSKPPTECKYCRSVGVYSPFDYTKVAEPPPQSSITSEEQVKVLNKVMDDMVAQGCPAEVIDKVCKSNGVERKLPKPQIAPKTYEALRKAEGEEKDLELKIDEQAKKLKSLSQSMALCQERLQDKYEKLIAVKLHIAELKAQQLKELQQDGVASVSKSTARHLKGNLSSLSMKFKQTMDSIPESPSDIELWKSTLSNIHNELISTHEQAFAELEVDESEHDEDDKDNDQSIGLMQDEFDEDACPYGEELISTNEVEQDSPQESGHSKKARLNTDKGSDISAQAHSYWTNLPTIKDSLSIDSRIKPFLHTTPKAPKSAGRSASRTPPRAN
jgi:hypothetical protein